MVHDAKTLSPDQAVAAAKERLRASVQQMAEELGQAVDQTQNRVIHTVDEVQKRVHDSAKQMSEAAHKPLEQVRKRPLESVAVAAVAGLVIGLLSHSSKDVHKTSAHRSGAPAARGAAEPQSSSMLSGIVMGGLGKMVFDTLREEYLTPQNIRSWLRTVLKPSRGSV